MKSILSFRTLALLLLLVTSANSWSQVLGEVIYNWDFATGLPNDWTNTSASGIGLWEYRGPNTDPSNAVGARGTCASSALPLNSNTVANGFMIFDSNYWDDAVPPCGGLGTGVDPAPHNASLTSGVLNFTGYTAVTITFQQQYRIFSATTKVQVSLDGGNSWVDGGSNVGLNSPNVVWASYNLTSLVAGQGNVRIRFNFSGTYYWWLIDDVTIYSPNDNDIMVNSMGYTVNPTPTNIYDQLEYDQYPTVMIPPLRLRATGTNIGGLNQTGVVMNSKVVNSANTVLNNQNTPAITMTAGQVVNFVAPANYTPPATIDDYRAIVSLSQTQTDENTSNNSDTLDFSISAFTFARDEGPSEGVYTPTSTYATLPYETGNVFEGQANGRKCTSLAVGIGAGTQVGTTIQGIVYNESGDEVRAVTVPYTVNLYDLNEVGEEFTVVLDLVTPLQMYNDTVYIAMVKNLNGNEPFRVAYSGDAPASTSFINFYTTGSLFYLLKMPLVRMNIFLNAQNPGCLDPLAMNYDATAGVSDGSCRYPGCTIEGSDNYDPDANWDDGSCITQGCMDPLALNYNPFANVDNNSCEYGGCTNPDAINFDPTATVDDGTCIIPGCTNNQADNYNPEATEDDGSCFFLGCTDVAAANFDPIATIDDGSCLYAGCTNPLAINYNPEADIDNGTCIIEGCTDPSAANFNPDANSDNGSCEYPGCTDVTAANFDSNANVDDGSCLYFGCTDPTADNFDPNADINDGSCFYLGCTDELADNYDPTATIDDGSCLYLGCTDPNAANFDPIAIDDDGSCQYPGCTDPTAINFEEGTNVDDGSCEYNNAVFSLAQSSGCVPFTLQVNNQTVPSETSVCSFYLNGELIYTGCEDFTYTIETSGNYSLEYILEQAGGSDSFTVNGIIANAQPATPIVEFDDFNFELYCTNCTENIFAWTLDGVPQTESTSTIDVWNVDRTDNGTYTLTTTDEIGCSSSSVPFVLAIPFFSADVIEACTPGEVSINNYSDIPAGAFCTVDLDNGSPLQVINEGISEFNFPQAGVYNVTMTMTFGAVSNSSVQTVSISDGVTPILTWNAGLGLVICSNCASNGNASWTINGEPQVGPGPFSDQLGSIYQVELTTFEGCTASSAIIINGIEELIDESFSLFPNPAKEKVQITSNYSYDSIEIYDAVGKIQYRNQLNGMLNHQIDISSFNQGIYVLRVISSEQTVTRTFQIIR